MFLAFVVIAIELGISSIVFGPMSGDASAIVRYGTALAGFAGERRYLVLAVDPAELRPAGGYTGTVGTVGFDHGHVVERTFGDVYRFDTKPDMPFVEPPDAVQNHLLGDASWRIADGAWSPDFPTAAQDTLRMYELESGDTNIDGVIVLTTFAVDRLLEAIGPVTVPDYGVTVSSGETTMIALGLTRGVSTQTSDRKAFLDDLASEILHRLQSISPLDALKVRDAFEEIRDRRDVMVWVKDPAAEAWFAASPFGGAVSQKPGDYVYVVEANVEPPSKYNLVVGRADTLDVALDQAGTASDTLSMNWQNFANSDGVAFDLIRSYSTNNQGLYGDYVRVLTPAVSQLGSVAGNAMDSVDEVEETSTVAGRKVFGNYLLMAPGPSQLTYAYTVPGAATESAQGIWSYELTVQRQPGATLVPITVTVSLPDGAQLVSTTANYVSGNQVQMSTTLDRDVTLELRYRLP